ncbi:MAG: hypothetical protein IT581_07225 [Verrucomicrobiales bacterium]|nr:hypothetical protein [Verrucomicrobiales bacterium]
MISRGKKGEASVSNRRGFLKSTGAALLGAGWSGCASHSVSRTTGPKGEIGSGGEVRVHVRDKTDPGVARAWAVLRTRVEERVPVRWLETRSHPDLVLQLNSRLGPETFRLESAGGAVRIEGGSPSGLVHGVGKFLRTSRYDGKFEPSKWRGMSEPRGSVRGMYFASHFHNWYHQAPEQEIVRYLEDLALWGVNAVMVIFPMINLQGWDDPQAEPAMEMVRRYARAIRGLGMQFATGLNNTMFIGAPASIRAGRLPDPTGRRGNSGHPICPSNPEGHAYLVANSRALFERLKDVGLDILVHWPYDEGGCSCEQCKPWGSNGYLRLSSDLTKIGREYFPKLKSVLSTWMFDTPPEGEWAGLTDSLARDRSWADFILADAHEDFPRYPLDVGVPGGLPLLNFPEISMWGNWPWGGYGANPLPGRYQRLWNQVKVQVGGGFPYSEGIYEDLNKAVVAQFYWDPNRSARETLVEYATYEFGAGPTTITDFLSLIDALEDTASRSYRKEPVNHDLVERARLLAESLQAFLPDWGRRSWRWEILHLRAILDRERFVGGNVATPEAEESLLRLIELYHAELETDDPYHHRVRPPLKRAVSRKGNL